MEMASGRSRVLIKFDDLTDVVSVYLADTIADRVRPAPHDRHMMLEVDTAGSVVGVEVQGASSRMRARWELHPDRSLLPGDLLLELDAWLNHRWADLKGVR